MKYDHIVKIGGVYYPANTEIAEKEAKKKKNVVKTEIKEPIEREK